MGSHILFLVHGVGEHATEWAEAADGPVETLKSASRQYAFFDTVDLESRVDLVPVHYDEVFSQVIKAWKQNAAAVNELDTAGVLKPALGWLANASEEQFWWSRGRRRDVPILPPVQAARSHACDQAARGAD